MARPTTNKQSKTTPAKKPAPDAAPKLSSSDKVVEGVVGNLLSGRYVPGQKLLENDLSRDFGLSRGPVREAIKRLDAQGVVRLTPNRGAFIRAFTRQEMDELFVVLEYLVGLMAKLAADAIKEGNDPKPVKEAYALLAPYKEPGTGELSYIEHRRHFYETLIDIGGNKQLARHMPTVDVHIIRAQFLPFMTIDERTAHLKEYAAITEAVLDGNAKKAEQVARKHICESHKRLARLPDSAFAAQ